VSTTTTESPVELTRVGGSTARTEARRPLLWAAIASEWTKLRSVRSTVYSLLATIAITVGFGALLSWAYVHRYDRLSLQERATFDATAHSLRGLFLSQLAIGVLGVLIISAEYTTGLIRPTFTAIPQRRTVLAAKAIVFGTVALVIATISCLSAFVVGQSILSTKHLNVSLADPGVFRAVCGACAYLVFVALLGLGLGTVVRRTAGAISTLFGLVLVLPLLALALPSPWNHDVAKILPGQAGQAMFAVRPDADLLSPAAGALVCLVWLAVTYAIATVLLSRRDA
jgi:ABC-type transport system involved in multi-copper enzyme maturation permease subunit